MSQYALNPQALSGHDDQVLSVALGLAGYAVFEIFADGRMFWRGGAEQALGLDRTELDALQDQHSLSLHLTPEACLHRQAMIDAARARSGQYRVEYQLQRANAPVLWLEERGRFVDINGQLRLVGALRQISERKRREARLDFLTSRDELTGVYNRTRLREELESAIAEAAREANGWVYLVGGIDDLGFVNTDYGFDVADQVIAATARRMETVLRPGDTVGRIAGAKFGFIARFDQPGDLDTYAAQLIAAVRDPVIATSDGPVAASISFGAVWLGAERPTSETAMAAAEHALAEAKTQGKGGFVVAKDELQRTSRRRRNASLAEGLIGALNDGRIHLAYQPIVDATTRKVRHYEALIRLEDEEGEIKPAGEFIMAAEALGLIHLLDRRALDLALSAMDGAAHIRLAVNVSAASVADQATADAYLLTLEARPDLAQRLTVELTETCLATDRKRTAAFITRLRGAGAKFSIDDFGAGYTSFQNLLAFDVDQVKIDGEFIKAFSTNSHNQTFVRTLVELAKSFRLETVAEWVESDADAVALAAMGVDGLQGFYLGKPELGLPK